MEEQEDPQEGRALGRIGCLVAAVQMVLHYLGIIAIVFGVVAYAFGNSERAKELLIGGVGWLALKYLIGVVFVLTVGRRSRES